MENIILAGYGGHARSVADCIERQREFNIIGYTDLKKYESPYTYLGNDDVLKKCYDNGIHNAAICIGYLGKGELRQNIYLSLKKIGFNLPVIIDPSAIVSKSAQINEGVFIGKGAIVNAEAKIGKAAIINSNALVEHGCSVGNFAHIAVSAVLCGQVKVGDFAFVGASSTIIQHREIHRNQIIPAGSVVR
jgi:sugar O-acyltransferase, sialic acid O-acetyltransferase NeuD family